MKFFAVAALATVSANQYESMNEDELLVNLESILSSAFSSEARGDGDAAVAAETSARTTAITALETSLLSAIAVVQADVDQNETDSDTAIAAVQADVARAVLMTCGGVCMFEQTYEGHIAAVDADRSEK